MREMLKKYKITEYDFFLVAMILITNIFGILAVTSSFPELKTGVIGGSIFSFLVMIVLSLVDYSFLLKFNWLFYIANLVLLLLVKFSPMGKVINGARRWLEIGIKFQPSEAAKILLIPSFDDSEGGPDPRRARRRDRGAGLARRTAGPERHLPRAVRNAVPAGYRTGNR